MKFTTFSITNNRFAYTHAIRMQLSNSFWWEETKVPCVNGATDDINNWIKHHDLTVNRSDIKVGQLGIWMTVLNAMEYLGDEPFVTFEDDAILHPAFNDLFWMVTSTLPKDTDAFALFLPRDQDHVYHTQMNRGKLICKAYQRYGGVSMLWTPRGVKQFKSLVARDGITDQWDDQLFKYAKAGEMNVYTQPPSQHVLVSISGTENSIVQETQQYAG